MLIVVVITSGVVVVGSMVGFQQNSSPVPQCPNTEQHSPISWLQSESEAQLSLVSSQNLSYDNSLSNQSGIRFANEFPGLLASLVTGICHKREAALLTSAPYCSRRGNFQL